MRLKKTEILRHVFYIMFISVIFMFVITQIIRKDGNSAHKPVVEILNTNAIYLAEDGNSYITSVKDIYINRPVEVGNDYNRVLYTIPTIPDNDYQMVLFTGNYDVEVYIEGNLRVSYNDLDIRKWGTYSHGKYIFIPIQMDDSNKDMLITYKTTLSQLNTLLCVPVLGASQELYLWLFYRYVWQLYSAIILMVLGLVFFGYSLIAKKNHFSDKGIQYLGSFSILMSFWIMSQLDIREIYFTFSGDLVQMTSFCLMLLPMPMIFFFNTVTNGEYKRIYSVLQVVAMVNFMVVTVNVWRNTIDIVEWMFPTRIIIMSTCFLAIVTFTIFSRKRKVESSSAILLGMYGLTITTIVEYINMYFTHSFYLGKYICFGILFFILTLGYAAIRGMATQEKEYNEALRASSEKTSFLANMSHEIRTPINTIMGMDEMILRETNDKNIEHYALNIRNSGKMLLSLINDVLDYSKIDSGNVQLKPRRYDLANLINDVINDVKLRAYEKNLQLEIDVDEKIPSVLYGDDLRLKQAIGNILTNAVKYTHKGKIQFKLNSERISSDEEKLIFTVSDTGIGIKEEDIERMFDSFVRLETNKNRSIEGTGLGMAITKNIIDMMGGTITVESEYQKGSTFTVKVITRFLDSNPIGAMDVWYRSGNKNQFKYVEKYQSNDAKILVVDDNEMNIEVIKGLLKNTGIQIDEATNGQQCIEMMLEKDYDVVFLDHMMPGMDGVETLRYIKENEILSGKKIPVVALTANALAGARDSYIRYGFSDYISKPVEYSKLAETLTRFIPDKFKMKEKFKNQEKRGTLYLENHDINVSQALKYSGEDVEQYIKLLDMFVSERAKKKREDIAIAFEKKDWDSYSILFHGLKNTARTIGADRLADMAFEHEINSKQQNSCFILENYDNICDEWASVSQVINTYLAEIRLNDEPDGQTIEVENEGLDNDEWEKKVQEVISCLEGFKKKEALLILEDLAKHRLKGERHQRIVLAIMAVQNYDYECAVEELKKDFNV